VETGERILARKKREERREKRETERETEKIGEKRTIQTEDGV